MSWCVLVLTAFLHLSSLHPPVASDNSLCHCINNAKILFLCGNSPAFSFSSGSGSGSPAVVSTASHRCSLSCAALRYTVNISVAPLLTQYNSHCLLGLPGLFGFCIMPNATVFVSPLNRTSLDLFLNLVKVTESADELGTSLSFDAARWRCCSNPDVVVPTHASLPSEFRSSPNRMRFSAKVPFLTMAQSAVSGSAIFGSEDISFNVVDSGAG